MLIFFVPQIKSKSFEYKGDPLNGLLFNMKDSSNLNEIVKLHPCSIWDYQPNYEINKVENLLDYSCDNRWYSGNNMSRPFIIFEFPKNFLFITNYSFSFHNLNYPIDWFVDGSNNRKKCVRIGSVNNYNYEKDGSKKTFPVINGAFKYIRFTQTKNHFDSTIYEDTFVLVRVEFFGYFGNDEKYLVQFLCRTQKMSFHHFNPLISLLFFMINNKICM